MKKLLIVMLVVHTLFEGLIGILLVVSPSSVLPNADAASLAFAVNYGFAAITMASVVVWLWPQRHHAPTLATVLGILTTFHLCLAAGTWMGAAAGGDILPSVIHATLAVIFAVLFTSRAKLSES